jgi:preprotein translocase subunit SecE
LNSLFSALILAKNMNKLVAYLKASIAEMKKVSWPTRKETTQYTILVIAISLVVAALLGGFDYLFNWIIQTLLSRQLF